MDMPPGEIWGTAEEALALDLLRQLKEDHPPGDARNERIRKILGEMHILRMNHHKQNALDDEPRLCQDPEAWWKSNQRGHHILKLRSVQLHAAAEFADGIIDQPQFICDYEHIMEHYTQSEGIFKSPHYVHEIAARQHAVFYDLDYLPDSSADHLGMDQTTIEPQEQIPFDVVAPILYGTRIASRYFISTVTRMISECAVLPEGDSDSDADRQSVNDNDPKRFALKFGEAVDPGCEDPYPPGGDHHDSCNDTGDSDVIAGLLIPEGCLRTCLAQDQND